MENEYLAFLRELPRSFTEIGAMLPSSPLLGRAMVKPLREGAKLDRRPLKILEVGPGTGPFTRQILRFMGPEDTFTVCEINARFLHLLQRKLAHNKSFQRNADRVQFVQCPVQELRTQGIGDQFDIIISSLPFSNFMPETVEEILTLFRDMTAEGGRVIFCEYIGLRKISSVFSTPAGRKRVEGVERVIQQWSNRVSTDGGEVRKRLSLLNVPPAYAIEFDYNGLNQQLGGRSLNG